MKKEELENYSLFITVEDYNVRGNNERLIRNHIHELPIRVNESIKTNCGFIKIEDLIEDDETNDIIGLIVKNDGDEQNYKTVIPINQSIIMRQTYGTKPDVYHLCKSKLLLTKNNNYYKNLDEPINVNKLILKK